MKTNENYLPKNFTLSFLQTNAIDRIFQFGKWLNNHLYIGLNHSIS